MTIKVDDTVVRKLRRNRSWTQENLADACGINLRTVQRIEKDGVASLRSCKSIARAFEIEPMDLLVDDAEECATRPRSNLAVPALIINAVVFIVWGIAQMIISIFGFGSKEAGLVSFLFLFFAGMVLLTFLTPIAKSRLSIVGVSVVIAMILTPANILWTIAFTLILWLLFECSRLLASHFAHSGNVLAGGK